MNILLELTWRGALMTVVIASLDRLCAARINARVRRVWWLLVPLAFLVTVPVPVLPPPTSVVPGSVGAHEAVPWLVNAATRPAGQIAAVAPSPFNTMPWTLIIAAAGSVVYLLVVLGRTYSALRRWREVPLCTDPVLLLALEECKAEAGITTPIGLVVSERISTPLILGWLHPRILLPGTLVTGLSREQLRGVLFHELAHLRLRDVPCAFLFTLVCALHWFNPAAHLALRWWAQFREEAADEAAIRWLGRASSADYGETLLHVLRHTNEQPAAPFLTLSIVESVSQLRKRLTMIKHYERRSPHLLFTGTIFVAAALGILLRPVQAQNAPAKMDSPPATTSEKTALPSDPQESAFVTQMESALRSGDLSQLRPLLCERDVAPEIQAKLDQCYQQTMAYLKTRAGWSLERIPVSSLPESPSGHALNLVPAYGLEVVNFGDGKRCRFAIGVVDGKYQIAESANDFRTVASSQSPLPQAHPPGGAEVAASPACKDFVARFVAAINSKDAEKLKALLHPKCIPLLNEDPDSANFLQNRLEFYSQFTIPEQHDIFVTAISPDAELPWPNGVIWPVRPTNQVGINYKDAHGKKTGCIVFVAADGDKWYEVISTPGL